MSQNVKLQYFQQTHTPSGNQLTGSYFCSVTSYDTQTRRFTALSTMYICISDTTFLMHTVSKLLIYIAM